MTVNMLLPQSDRATSSRTVAEWLWPFVPMGAAAFSLSALVYYHLRQNVFEVRSPLQQFYAWLYRTIGFAPAVMLCGLVIVWSTIWLATGRLERAGSRVLRLLAMTVMLGIFLNLGDGAVAPAAHKGALGAWFADTLVGTFGYWPSLVVVWAMTFASLLLATDFFFHDSFERLRRAAPAGERETGVEPAVTEHLRGLSALAPSSAPATASPGPAVPAPETLDQAFAAAAALDLDEGPGAAVAEPDPSPRRRSYAERRAERESRWRQPVAADEPMAPVPSADAADASAGIDAPSQEQHAVAGLTVTPPPADNAPSATGTDALSGEGDEADEVDEGDAVVELLDDDIPSARDGDGEREEEDEDEDEDDGAERDPEGADLAIRGAHSSIDQRAAAAAPTAERDDDGDGDDDDGVRLPLHGDFAAERAERWATRPPWAEQDAEDAVPAEPEPQADAESAAPTAEVATEREARIETAPPRAEADEPVVAIPRPPSAPEEAEPRQQQLFGGSQLDEVLVQEAIDVVTGAGRASVALLQRKLRVDYALAAEVLTELAARGVVALDGDATTGRVLR